MTGSVQIGPIGATDPARGGVPAVASAPAPAPAPASPDGTKKLEQVARSFESIFLSMLLSSMRKTIVKGGPLSGGRGEEVYTNLLDTAIADQTAHHGKGLGLARMIVEKYSRHVQAAEGRNGNGTDIRP